MIGRCRFTSYASVWMCAGSSIVTDPLPSTSRMPFGLTSAAVSSSIPIPSSAGDCATRASSRPNRLRCSKCWSMSTPGRSPRPALICVMRCFGVAPLVPKATMWLAMAEAPALVPATMAPCRWRSTIARPRSVPPITLERRSWLPPVMKMAVASSSDGHEAPIVRVVADQGTHAAHVGDPHLAKEGQIQLGRFVAERRGRRDDHHSSVAAARERHEARQDLALAQLVLRSADDEKVSGPGLPGAGRGRHGAQHTELRSGPRRR